MSNKKNCDIQVQHIIRSSKNDIISNQTFDFYYCSIVVNGSGFYVDELLNVHPIEPVCIYQNKPGVPFSLIIDFSQRWEEYNFIMPSKTYEALIEQDFLRCELPVLKCEWEPFMAEWIHDIFTLKKRESPYSSMETYFNIQRFIITVHNYSRYPHWSYDYASIRRTIIKIHRDGVCLHTTAELAAECNMTEDHFRKAFISFTGKSPFRYLKEENMKYAKMLLCEGKSVQETSEILGYADPFSFSKSFKKELGLSPVQFIKENSK